MTCFQNVRVQFVLFPLSDADTDYKGYKVLQFYRAADRAESFPNPHTVPWVHNNYGCLTYEVFERLFFLQGCKNMDILANTNIKTAVVTANSKPMQI